MFGFIFVFASCCSLLKLPNGAKMLSGLISAAASKDAMTCVGPPAEQPCCSVGENRLYIILSMMNLSAF